MQTGMLAAVLLVGLSCSSMAQPESTTGIEGTITIAPARPGPTRIDIPNSAPLADVPFVVQNEKGNVASFATDDQGQSHILLAPGRYTVSRKDKSGGVGRFGPFEVEVVAGKMTKVEALRHRDALGESVHRKRRDRVP
jgi:hypothetical protein